MLRSSSPDSVCQTRRCRSSPRGYIYIYIYVTSSIHITRVSAAKDDDDNENPDLLNQVVQFTTPYYSFTKFECLLLLVFCGSSHAVSSVEPCRSATEAAAPWGYS